MITCSCKASTCSVITSIPMKKTPCTKRPSGRGYLACVTCKSVCVSCILSKQQLQSPLAAMRDKGFCKGFCITMASAHNQPSSHDTHLCRQNPPKCTRSFHTHSPFAPFKDDDAATLKALLIYKHAKGNLGSVDIAFGSAVHAEFFGQHIFPHVSLLVETYPWARYKSREGQFSPAYGYTQYRNTAF